METSRADACDAVSVSKTLSLEVGLPEDHDLRSFWWPKKLSVVKTKPGGKVPG